jgi:hypothetical protein
VVWEQRVGGSGRAGAGQRDCDRDERWVRGGGGAGPSVAWDLEAGIGSHHRPITRCYPIRRMTQAGNCGNTVPAEARRTEPLITIIVNNKYYSAVIL